MNSLLQQPITNKTLAIRLAVTLAVLFGVAGAIVYGFSASLIEQISQNERASLFTSIESGPLQLARLNSGDLANTYLSRLSTVANAQNASVVGTEIVSGPGGLDVYAKWNATATIAEKCLTKVDKSVIFPDGVNPFIIRLLIDHCATREPLNQVSRLCLVIGVLLVLLTGVACLLAALPVFSSLRSVSALLDTTDDAPHDLSKMTYLPLRLLSDKVIENRKLVQEAAVARMTQMLAHDVRKPFSILRMGLGMLGSAKDPAAVKSVLSRLVPEIDKAVSSVDGLIADVMEVGSTSTQLIQEPASPESLIEATLGEVFRIYPKAEVSISYDLRHTHMANVHVQKVGRVFSNIVGNAVQAMGKKGVLWFKTRERDGLVEFCLGNAGSIIPAESLPKLFDAFFTSGKKGGTGLGLAIAQKVVTAHGGRIWCESSKTLEHPDGKVEFFFTLPVAVGLHSRTTAKLPSHSTAITKALSALVDITLGEGSVDKGELTLEEDILQAQEKMGRPVRILIIDDEAVYRSGLVAYLSRTPGLSAAMSLHQAEGSEGALQALREGIWDLMITDVDMGPESLDGFALARNMRANGFGGLVCIHSNRIVAADHKTAIEAGADAFLPKPVTRAQLLKLVLQAIVAATHTAPHVERKSGVALGQLKPHVAIVDDNPFILDAWKDKLKVDATVHVFTSLEALAERLEADPEFAGRLLLAVTDMHLDGSGGDGLDVGRLLKQYSPKLRVLLSSDGSIPEADFIGAIDRAIGKDPVGLAALNVL